MHELSIKWEISREQLKMANCYNYKWCLGITVSQELLQDAVQKPPKFIPTVQNNTVHHNDVLWNRNIIFMFHFVSVLDTESIFCFIFKGWIRFRELTAYMNILVLFASNREKKWHKTQAPSSSECLLRINFMFICISFSLNNCLSLGYLLKA